MIRKVYLNGVATYRNGINFNPKKINFVYGANGTGKSTISKVLYGEKGVETCEIEWEPGVKEEIVVYNRSFVKRNFESNSELKGIFTLGEESIDIQKDIKEKRKEIDLHEQQKNSIQNSILKIEKEIEDLKSVLELKCWETQKSYGAEFSEALVGYRGKMKSFCEKCISSLKEFEKEDVLTLDELRVLYQAVYSQNTVQHNKYQKIITVDIQKLDSHPLLGTIIVGKKDTPIGTFIDFLQSSDWVEDGIEYAKKVPGKCPYCQQDLSENLERQIEEYFDESYKTNKADLALYAKEYSNMISSIKDILHKIDEGRIDYLDYGEYDTKKQILLLKLEANMKIILDKEETLSKKVEIESILKLVQELNAIIDNFNSEIEKNNEYVKNHNAAKEKCIKAVWNFMATQRQSDIVEYLKQVAGREKGKKQLLSRKIGKETKIMELKNEIANQEEKVTRVEPTVKAINEILKGFGFTGFLLAVNETEIGTYKIIRPSGEDASETLSEGEHNFISFLYFYHMCFGSQTKTGIANNKVLVIDDPISSMDSNVIFIVSTLVKNMLRDCKNDDNGIKQIIVLTHNVYFHKEITYWGNKDALPTNSTKYFILKKNNEETFIEEYDANPISTSYELLWQELRNTEDNSCNTMLNVMRRILEHYFTFVGGINYEACINQFEGTDKIICKALIAFINDGSHSVFEDLIFTPSDGSVERYKQVFEKVFDKLGHIEHYKMMMNK